MKRLCVFCGSRSGKGEQYLKFAREFGALLAKNNVGLVYGGASVGVMGILASSVLEHGGEVWGVMPQSLINLEVAHKGLKHFFTVQSMHERKQKMYDLSDGFMALPGGMGTLDEFFEIVTWSQLKHHHRPCWVMNYSGFYQHQMNHLRHAAEEGFITKDDLNLVRESKSPEEWLQDWLRFA